MAKQKELNTTWVLLILFLVVGLFIFTIYQFISPQKKLPIYNPSDFHKDLVDVKLQNKGADHIIADFTLTNQNNQTVTNKDYKDKIYVADFFFTRCQTICIPMTENMKVIQDAFKNDKEIMLLSHSVTPIIDSVPILRKYADVKGIIDEKWHITTGEKQHIYELARESYFAVLDEGDGDLQDFIHTEKFILVDKKKRIRGHYDGTSLNDVQKLIKDIKLLKESN